MKTYAQVVGVVVGIALVSIFMYEVVLNGSPRHGDATIQPEVVVHGAVSALAVWGGWSTARRLSAASVGLALVVLLIAFGLLVPSSPIVGVGQIPAAWAIFFALAARVGTLVVVKGRRAVAASPGE